MEGFLAVMALYVVLAVVGAIQKARKQQQGSGGGPPRPARPTRRPAAGTVPRPASRPTLASRTMGGSRTAPRGGTQGEGSKLEEWLRRLEEMEAGAQGRGRGPLGRPSGRSLPPAEEVEDRTSLEVEPEVGAYEVVVRPPRVEVDSEDDLDRLVAGRVKAAEARNSELTLADHLAFDAAVRPAPPDDGSLPSERAAAGPLHGADLRRAVIWREILGEPRGIAPWHP